jgi:hypothetical protein
MGLLQTTSLCLILRQSVLDLITVELLSMLRTEAPKGKGLSTR